MFALGFLAGRRQINITLAVSQTTTYDVFTAAGSPSAPCDVTLTINAGVELGGPIGASAQAYAMTTAGFPAGSSLSIINNGYILGRGGLGGRGEEGLGGSMTPGEDGSGAINLGLNTTITNGSGFIFGGGGGGGGGARSGANAGSGGGGGAPYQTGGPGGSGFPTGANGDAGATATRDAGGAPGMAGNDGGTGGLPGGDGSPGQGPGAAGGVAGKAINLNGFTATFLSGNDATHLKGVVS
jgi:hypothetical protein